MNQKEFSNRMKSNDVVFASNSFGQQLPDGSYNVTPKLNGDDLEIREFDTGIKVKHPTTQLDVPLMVANLVADCENVETGKTELEKDVHYGNDLQKFYAPKSNRTKSFPCRTVNRTARSGNKYQILEAVTSEVESV